ncbi:MAG TPA: hypothetical protein VGR72_05730 [Candidatus Acidoferrales bacterium]|nr:hypothetical protein [Candidatus Acidoferrales bacterium]
MRKFLRSAIVLLLFAGACVAQETSTEREAARGKTLPHPDSPDMMPPAEKAASPARAHRGPNDRPWWIGGEFGEGQLKLTSDQSSGSRISTFELGFVGGHTLGNRARLGVELNGWLLQASNANNPTVGESVSDVIGVFDFFPSRKLPFFLRAGTGLGLYSNNRPNGFNGHGLGWTTGGGYEIPLTERLGLAPMIGYAAGGLGDVRNAITVQTNRRYSVIEVKAAILWHFGAPRKTD